MGDTHEPYGVPTPVSIKSSSYFTLVSVSKLCVALTKVGSIPILNIFWMSRVLSTLSNALAKSIKMTKDLVLYATGVLERLYSLCLFLARLIISIKSIRLSMVEALLLKPL